MGKLDKIYTSVQGIGRDFERAFHAPVRSRMVLDSTKAIRSIEGRLIRTWATSRGSLLLWQERIPGNSNGCRQASGGALGIWPTRRSISQLATRLRPCAIWIG